MPKHTEHCTIHIQVKLLLVIYQDAICVQKFDDSRSLRFTLLIAVHYVLPRCISLVIPCKI